MHGRAISSAVVFAFACLFVVAACGDDDSGDGTSPIPDAGRRQDSGTKPARDAGGEPPSSGTACEVNGKVYPSGTGGIIDPFSCNMCQCSDGQLGCTKIACPKACPDGTAPGKSCSRCGPADGCEVLRTGCLPECEDDQDCAGTGLGQCFDGSCRILCG